MIDLPARRSAAEPRDPAASGDSDVAPEAVELAERLLTQALAGRTSNELAQEKRMNGLIDDPLAKRLAMAMTDQVIRSEDATRSAAGWRRLLRAFGLPQGFGMLRRGLLATGGLASKVLPSLVMRAVRGQLRRDSREVILPAEEPELSQYLAKRKEMGWRTNLNPLGEAVLGEEEAQARLEAVLAMLARPDVSHVSVKISSIFSQINVVAWDATLSSIKDRLRLLCRAALPQRKFINLDMEEHRDLALTSAAFREVLAEPEFLSLSAGIVFQAYLPDSWLALRELTLWARHRVAAGGEPVRVRIVKGANLAMEQVEAELHGWSPAPYATKAETDANFKRMLDFACQPENAAAVRVGVASHNLFDVALALVLREARGVRDRVEIEMLEGMANHQARAVKDEAGSLLVYAPVVHERDFGSALAYLIRRLDENTAEENYLRHLFDLAPGSAAWGEQKRRFLAAWEQRHDVSHISRRATLPALAVSSSGFSNVPDTDWTQAANRARLAVALQQTGHLPPLVLPSVDEVLETARKAQPGWQALGDAARAELLQLCAKTMSDHRFETIALLNGEGKKAVVEADAEVSEAIDFANCYAATGSAKRGQGDAFGTVVVAPPWNFPFAIPCGGVLAALMAGNSVILKPAPEVVNIGRMLARQLWEAGIPRDVLQFFPCSDGTEGKALITDPRTSAVVLTGAYETARLFHSWRPSLPLFAETSGKNSIIVSALADRDLAIKDMVRSAFGHAGQKCSAASLAIMEAEVYDSPDFRRQLRDAAASLAVGPSSDLASVVTPLIRPAGEALHRALTTLEPGESWLLEPRQAAHDPCLWSPGIKLGVAQGSWFHQTECFGPVLGLMRARDLDHASEMQNAVSYGLTAGFHSLDQTEISAWKEKAQAGNLYVNRVITGAIVQRQPFGGWKRSSIGPGSKAGGPNYVGLFRQPSTARVDPARAEAGYRAAWDEYFSQPHDPSGLGCESNVFRYRPSRGVILRLGEHDEAMEKLARLAAELCQVPLQISVDSEEDAAAFAARLPELARSAEFLRTMTAPSDEVLRAAHAADLNWINAPFSENGRVELGRWLREQSISETLHRYGNRLSYPKGKD